MRKHEDLANARCEAFKEKALSSDPAVKYMMSALKRGGCDLTDISCRTCDGNLAGGFRSDGGVILCSDTVRTQSHLSTTLVHESVHAFDQCRAKVDWSNCVHHACSEIRAAALSGDCTFGREVLLRRNIGLGGQFQKCVRRRAELSVAINPNCDAINAKEAVDRAWDACYNDPAPFEKIP